MHQRTLKKVLPKLNKTVWKMHFMVHFIGHARFLQLFNRRCHINSIIIFVFVHSFFKQKYFGIGQHTVHLYECFWKY